MKARFTALAIPLALAAFVHCSSSQETAVTSLADAGGPREAGVATTDAGDSGAQPDAAPPPLAPMSKARSLFPTITGRDSRIRIFAGLSAKAINDDTESYDPATNTWTAGTTTSPVARYGHAGAQDAAGIVYLFGGTSDGQSPIAAAETFTPANGTWKTLADLPTARLGLGVATGKDGKIYAIGGRNAAGNATDLVETFDATTQTWSTGPSMPTKRLAFAAVTGVDGKIYAVGGRDTNNVPVGDVAAFDTTLGTWETLPPLAKARYWLGVTVGADGKIYALGGIDAFAFVDDAEVLTPGAAWTKLPAMPEARGWIGAASSADGRIFVMGGANNDDTLTTSQAAPQRSMFAFDTKTSTWTK